MLFTTMADKHAMLHINFMFQNGGVISGVAQVLSAYNLPLLQECS